MTSEPPVIPASLDVRIPAEQQAMVERAVALVDRMAEPFALPYRTDMWTARRL